MPLVKLRTDCCNILNSLSQPYILKKKKVVLNDGT